MAYQLPPLPYPYDALEPHIDARTLEIHHDKHHAAYLANLNKALESAADLLTLPADELLKDLSAVPESIRTAVRNNGGGFVNHNFYWEGMAPQAGGEPVAGSPLAAAIQKGFGDFSTFKEKFTAATVGRFGSGWGWLSVDKNWATGDSFHGQPGQPADGGLHTLADLRRMGACLLPELPEPAGRLRGRVVERGQLGEGGTEVRGSVLRNLRLA